MVFGIFPTSYEDRLLRGPLGEFEAPVPEEDELAVSEQVTV